MKIKISALCLALSVMSASAESFYAFTDAGTSKHEIALYESYELSDSDISWSLGIGYNITKNIAAELAYRNFGSIDYAYGGYNEEFEMAAYQASVLRHWFLGEDFSLLARLGVAILHHGYTETGNGTSYSESSKGAEVFGGLGVHYVFTQQFAVRAEYNLYSTLDGVSVDALAIGAELYF